MFLDTKFTELTAARWRKSTILVINTHKGLFKYRRLPFGISSAPAIFQRVMGKVPENLKGVSLCLDDILVRGRDDRDHLDNLSAVLQRLQQHGLRIRREKCSFWEESVQYLRHVIDSEGIRVSKEMRAPGDQCRVEILLGYGQLF